MKNENNQGPLFPTRSSVGWNVLWVASIALLYFAVARFSLFLIIEPEGIAAIWPPTGIFLSAILLTRNELRPWLVGTLFITDFIVEMMAGTLWVVSFFYALALALDAVISAFLLLRFVSRRITLQRMPELIGWLSFSVILSNSLASLIAAAASQLLPGTSFWASWLEWASSDGVGNFVITPLLLSLASWKITRLNGPNLKRIFEGAMLLIILAFLIYFSFNYLTEYSLFALLLTYLIFPIFLWAALRFGMSGVALASLILTTIAIYFTLIGHFIEILFANVALNSVIILQLYLSIMMLPSMLLATGMTERNKVETALRESETKFRAIFESSVDAIGVSKWGTHVFANAAYLALFGYSKSEELDDKSILELIAIDCREQIRQYVRDRAIGENVPSFYETRGLRKDGTQFEMDVHISSYKLHDELFTVAHLRDITKHKLADEALLESEQKYSLLFEQSKTPSALLKLPEAVFVDVNGAFEMMLGYKKEEMLGKTTIQLGVVKYGDWAQVSAKFDVHGSLRDEEIHLYTKSGEERIVLITKNTIELGRQHYALSTMQDITERKQMEIELQKANANLMRAQQIAHIGSWEDHLPTGELHWSDEMYRIMGLPPGSPLNLAEVVRCFPAEELARFQQAVNAAIEQDVPYSMDYKIIQTNGQERYVHDEGVVLRDESGQAIWMFGATQDITERKQAEQALHESEEHYRRIVDTAYEGIWVVDETYHTTFLNARMEEMLGYSMEEVLDKRVDSFLYESYPAEVRRMRQQLHHVGGQQERRLRRKDGSELWALVSAKPILDNENVFRGSFAMFSDITKRKRAEAALQRFAFIANTAPEFMSLVNRLYLYESVNDAYCRARGKARHELIGRSLAEVWGEALYQERLLPKFERCFSGEIIRYEETFAFSGSEFRTYQVGMYPYRDIPGEQVTHVVVVTSDITEYKQAEAALRLSALNLKKAQHFAHLGSWTWDIQNNHVEWSDEMYNIFDVDKETFTGSLPDVISEAIHPDDRAKVNASNLAVITEGKPAPLDYRIVRKDGSICVVWAEAGELIRDETGQPSFLSGTVQDITERKQLEEELRASLAEKEALLKEVHHRVKNNLQIISSLLSMQASNSQDKLVAHALEESKDRVRAMALIHEKLYQSKNLEYIEAGEYISELVDQLVSSFAGQMRNVSLEMQIADLTLDINKAIPCGMIINELVSNALKYAFPAQRGGIISVCLDIQDEKVRLVISDNGVGLPDNVNIQHPETLGLELVSILSHQLKASLEVTRISGTIFTITFTL